MQNLLPVFFLLIFSFSQNSCADPKAKDPVDEKVSEIKLTQTDKLAATAKVWGFLKYYHPEVAKGRFNWDDELFAVLEEVGKAETSRELSVIFSNWIDSLGEVKQCTTCLSVHQEEVFTKNFDLSWLEAEIFSSELSRKLRYIERNRAQGAQHYVAIAPAGNIVIRNETNPQTYSWENQDQRLLSLFRYWNQVEYFFPYKYQMDRTWDNTLEELLPLFLNAQSEQEFHLAMLQLAAGLDDSHAWFITYQTNMYYGFYWAPVKLKMIEGKAVVTGMYDDAKAEEDDWQVGDVLTSVAGVPVSQILAEDLKYMTGSNDPARHRDIEVSLLNGSTDSVEIGFLRDGELQKKKVRRYLKSKFKAEELEEPGWKTIESNIGYVNMGILEQEDVPRMMKELKSAKAIIFDIRNYPNETLYALARELNSEPMPFVKFTVPKLDYPGKFTWTQTLTAGENNPDAYKGKVILLVNEQTQSHAEFTAMALQTAPDVVVVGSQTAGADGNVSDISLLGRFRTYMSGIGVFYPDGRETQRIGIVPDMEVEPTLKGVKEGRDEVLEKALEIVMDLE